MGADRRGANLPGEKKVSSMKQSSKDELEVAKGMTEGGVEVGEELRGRKGHSR